MFLVGFVLLIFLVVCCVFGRIRVAHLFSFLCCVFGGIRVAHLCSFLCCVFGRIRVAQLFSDVLRFLLCLFCPVSCVYNVASFSGFSILDCPIGFL